MYIFVSVSVVCPNVAVVAVPDRFKELIFPDVVISLVAVIFDAKLVVIVEYIGFFLVVHLFLH
jgi:hypothetical protein